MYTSVEVANYFIKKSLDLKKPITQMKLQKLLYFAHGWSLALRHEPLLNESVEAWKYGPVVPTIYHLFKTYGNTPITKLQKDFYGQTPTVTDQETMDILDLVWDLYSDLSPIQLANITHEINSPWHQTIKEYLDKGKELPKGKDIDDAIISQYFNAKLEEVGV
jgi:uncharacterized phage-associated protein